MRSDGGHTTKLLIGGEAVSGTGTPLAVENPYTTETIAELPLPPWSSTPSKEYGAGSSS